MKTKMLILVGIAVCAILLASPVLATAGYSKIYGNANEDDVLDMRDVTYIKLVIFGKKPATTFADANNDGKISMLDIGQTKLIILGKEKMLTLVDQADRTVTVPRPVERVVAPSLDAVRGIVALDTCDKLVGISQTVLKYAELYPRKEYVDLACPELLKCPAVGSGYGQENLEVIVSLKPDVIITRSNVDTIQENTGIPVVCDSYGLTYEEMFEPIELIGTLLDKEEEAEELISLCEEKIDKVREVTSQIPEEEKPKVYLSTRAHTRLPSMGGFTRTLTTYEPLDVAGGINVAKDCGPSGKKYILDVSKEQIIAWNPDIILLTRHSLNEEAVFPVEAILADPDLQTVNAVKNESVYYVMNIYFSGVPQTKNIANALYLAKIFYPNKFEYLDLEKEGNEIFEAFYGADGFFTLFAGDTVWLREYLDSQK